MIRGITQEMMEVTAPGPLGEWSLQGPGLKCLVNRTQRLDLYRDQKFVKESGCDE